jgi:outer membrane protein assembly factor BamB
VIRRIAVLALAALACKSAPKETAPAPSASSSAAVVPLGTPLGPKGFNWIDQFTAPVGVDANGDGVEDMAGAFALEEDGRLVVWAGVLDGKTFDVMWKVGPFGGREKASRKTGVAVAGDRVLVVELTGKARLYALADGKEIASFPFKSQDVRGLCGPPAGETSFYLRKDWADGQLVDGKAGTAKSAPAPEWCVYAQGRRRQSDTGDTTSMSRASPIYGKGLPAGIESAFEADGDAVGIAKSTVSGFDPTAKSTRWSVTDLAVAGDQLAILDIGDGRAIVTVRKGLSASLTVIALDVKTGKKMWSADAPGAAPFTHTLTKKRLYLVCGEWPALPIDVLDVETGKLLARVGGT